MVRSKLDASIVATSFMQVRDGYILRYSPWAPFSVALAGPSRYFDISEPQQAEIARELLVALKRIRNFGPFWGGIAIAVFVAGAIWLISNDYTRSLLVPLFILAIAPLYLSFRFSYVRALRPLLDGLPRTDSRMTFGNRLKIFSAGVPLLFLLSRLVFFCGLSVLSSIISIRVFSAAPRIVNLVPAVVLTAVFALLTIYYFCLLVLKATSAISTTRRSTDSTGLSK